MTYAPACRFAIALSALSLLAASCAGSGSTGTGGATGATGGSGASGGSSAAGGSGSGGTGSGGNVSSGSGGNVATGGSGGNASTGGTTGSGGTSATGGSSGATGTGGAKGGTTGSGGATGTGGAAGAGVTPFYTDDFESDTAGQQPAGWDNYIAYNYKTTNPQGDGTGALADATHTHNGSKLAVHFKASGGNPVFLERPLPTGTNHLYLRVFVYLMTAMGDLPSSSNDNHETLLGLTGDPTMDGTQVRFGQIKGVLGTNQVPSDNIAPVQAQWYSGPVISAGTWHCIQVEFDGSASYNTLRAYSDGTLVNSITAAADWQNSPLLPGNWMNGMFVDVMLGWQSFSSMANEIWMDDLALSTGPTSCN